MLSNFAASILVVIFGFLFVTVASRIVGLIGSSASPVSGMTIATLMATTAIFLVKGWTAPAFGALAITTIGSTVDPTNGDGNPYGLAIAPVSAGLLTAGDLVICNFNDSANVQGNGTTIERTD